MRINVDEIDDIEQLREIAKFRESIVDKYEETVRRIVPESHPAWKMNRGTDAGLLPVLKIFLKDCLQHEDIYNEDMVVIAGYLFRVIQNGISGYVKKKERQLVFSLDIALDTDIRNQLAKDMASNLVKNDSLLEKWHLMRIKHRKQKLRRMLDRAFSDSEYMEKQKKKIIKGLVKMGVID